jgi:hypothetical protein
VERRKWPAAMQNLNGILYWVSLNDFDAPCEIPTLKTKMHESLSVFRDLVTSDEGGQSCVILFLNKLVRPRSKCPRSNTKDLYCSPNDILLM